MVGFVVPSSLFTKVSTRAYNYTHGGSMSIANFITGKNSGKLFARISPNLIAGNILEW